jgi:uncharacterized membrane protein
LVGFIGFLDATYLTTAHYTGSALKCAVLEGCNEVANSKYSVFMGIPLALLGTFYYLTMILLTMFYYDTKNKIPLFTMPVIATMGILMSVVLVYLQLYVIKATCIYCMFSALTTTILFILNVLLIRERKKLSIPSEEETQQ